jgi:SAM-dependent methyltransferase
MARSKLARSKQGSGTSMAGIVDLLRAGRMAEARSALRLAAKRKPERAQALDMMARLDLREGHLVEALVGFSASLAAGREGAAAQESARYMAYLLAQYDLSEAAVGIDAAAFVLCLDTAEIDHQPVAMAALRKVKQSPPWARFYKTMRERGVEAAVALLVGKDGRAALSDRLMLACLRRAVCCDAETELLLTGFRAQVLRDGWPPLATDFTEALAQQCLLGEHVFAVTAEEVPLVSALVDAHDPATATPADLIKLALYRPPLAIPGFVDASVAKDPLLAELVLDAEQRREEVELADALPAISELDDSSAQVRAQYEDHPYPRWSSVSLGEAGAARRRLTELSGPGGGWQKPLSVLVAGCGTGRQAAMAARAYGEDSRVLAVDLSRRSLAHGMRMTGGLGLDNIEFRHGDILGLDGSAEPFDVIECVGVLHHMADPLAGWRALADRLRPGGMMLIGLYRELGRQHCIEARGRIAELGLAELGLAGEDDAIRDYRRQVLQDPEDPLHRILGGMRDFYSISGCRDLLFHVRERNYRLPEIAENLTELGLDFSGFQLPPLVQRQFQTRFPTPGAEIDLKRWDQFEQDTPDMFDAMYRFWCRKPTT